jgi:hypothetical protein
MFRICSVCKEEKELTAENFARNKSKFQWTCRPCHKTYRKEHYYRNRDKYLTMIKDRQNAIKEFISDYKTSRGCSKCGENHPACLDLHHLDPTQKTIEPSHIGGRGWGMDRVQRELDKCVVLCSNCHRKQHWRRGNASLFQSEVGIS